MLTDADNERKRRKRNKISQATLKKMKYEWVENTINQKMKWIENKWNWEWLSDENKFAPFLKWKKNETWKILIKLV